MSSKKFSLVDQAKEVADELEIPRVTLPSRPQATVEPPAEREGKGDEAAAEASTKPEVQPTPATKSALAKRSTTAVARQQALEPTEVEPPNPLSHLSREGPELAPLSCRVPKKVRQVLDQRVYDLKSRGKKIKMEDVVTAALVSFLKIED